MLSALGDHPGREEFLAVLKGNEVAELNRGTEKDIVVEVDEIV